MGKKRSFYPLFIRSRGLRVKYGAFFMLFFSTHMCCDIITLSLGWISSIESLSSRRLASFGRIFGLFVWFFLYKIRYMSMIRPWLGVFED